MLKMEGETPFTAWGDHETSDLDDFSVPLESTREEGVVFWKKKGLLVHHRSGEAYLKGCYMSNPLSMEAGQ